MGGQRFARMERNSPESARTRLRISDTWLVELYLSLYTLVWGVSHANPFVLTFPTAQSYDLFSRYYPGGETAFGLTIMAAGLVSFWAAIWGDRYQRGLTMAVGSMVWLAITVCVGVSSNGSSAGLWHFALASVSHWYCWARLRYRGPNE